jgi:hypothetical protein
MVARLFATLLICTVGISLGQTPPPRTRGPSAVESSPAEGVATGLLVESISHSSVKVRFATAIPGGNTSARVDYGITPELGFETRPTGGGSAAERARSVLVSGLRPATRYYFRPAVSDNKRKFDTSWTCPAAGNFEGYVCEQSGGLPYFVTAEAPPVVPAPPALPATVDTSLPAINGSTFTVAVDSNQQCTDLQQQLAAAAAADTSLNHQVVIPAGATCYGEFELPKKVGPGVVVIRPSTPDDQLPPPGTRIDPSYHSRLATLSTPPLVTSFGQDKHTALRTARCPSGVCTEGWRLIGIEITHPRHDQIAPTARKIVSIRGDVVTVDQPHGLVHFNQVYVAGVEGMAGANGTWQIGVRNPTSFRIRGARTSGAYTGGGYIVNALSSVITDCSNTAPIVCTTATPHGLTDPGARPIQSIAGGNLTLPRGHGLARNQAIEIRDSSATEYNGVWVVDQASADKVKLRDGPKRPCNSGCGTITPRSSVQIAEVQGNTAANGSQLFRVLSPTQIELPGTSGNGSYTSGGFLSYNPDIVYQVVELAPGSERIILDRCYVHGHGFPTRVLMAVSMHGSNSAIIDSYFDEFNYWGPVNPRSGSIEPGGRGTTIVDIGNGERLKLSNNAFLNAPGVPLFIQEFRDGPEMRPTDVSITRNLFYNSDRLRAGSEESDGRRYVSSHLIEIKKGKRILIDGNTFDGCWADRTPTGPAVAFSPRGVKGVSDNVVSDVTVTNNVFRRVSHAVYVIGDDGNRDFGTDISARFKISNNLFAEINYWKMHAEPAQSTGLTLAEGTGAGGAALWVLGAVEDLEFTHNTVLDQRGTNPKFVNYNSARSAGVVIRYNIFPHSLDQAKGGLTEAWALDWAVPAIKGSAADAFHEYFTQAPGPDPNSVFSDNVVIPGVRGTSRAENFDDSSPKSNFTKADCEEFYKGFSNITCVGSGKTAHKRFESIFGSLDRVLPNVALPGSPGIDEKGLEGALGMTVQDALRASQAVEASRAAIGARRAEAAPLRRDAANNGAVAQSTAAGGGCEGSRCTAADEDQLEALLARASCGDHIALPAGETLRVPRPIALGVVDCAADNPLVITTTAEAQLPAAGGRITPSHAPLLARLEAVGFPGAIFVSEAGSPARGVVLRGLELVGSDEARAAPLLRLEAAQDVGIEQCYLHSRGAIRSGPIALLAGERITVAGSFLEGDCVLSSGGETSTVVAGGAGPVSFRNNYIEAAGAALAGAAGAAIEFRHNTVERPASRNPCRLEWDGLYRAPAALIEMAAGARGVFEFNLFEDSWAGNLDYPAAVSLAAASSTVFRSNTFRGVTQAFQLAAANRTASLATPAAASAPAAVIEGNVLDSGAAASQRGVCGAQVLAALFGLPPAAGAQPSGLSLGCNSTVAGVPDPTTDDARSKTPLQPPAEAQARAPKPLALAAPLRTATAAAASCAELPPPAQILGMSVRAAGDRAVFQYAVSASSLSEPCVVEVWPAGRAGVGGEAAADNLTGRLRAASVAIEPGGSYDYRLMCGGDMRRGSFHSGDTGLTAANTAAATANPN